jgi:malate dehydrogenase (quinone)
MNPLWIWLILVVIFLGAVFAYLTRFWRKRRRKPLSAYQGAIQPEEVDILLVGAGAMSTTLGLLFQQLDPSLKICMIEKLGQVAEESTYALNNAGTGHAAYCELNYTPEESDGTINASKAFQINVGFETSLQFWAYLVEKGILPEPAAFIRQVPHLSLVWGEKDVAFLQKRYEAIKDSVAFGDMEYSEDPETLKKWMPLVMEGRQAEQRVAATRVRYGADVNFEALARSMTRYLREQGSFDLRLHRRVTELTQLADKRWIVEVTNTQSGGKEVFNAGFVFLGAGGGALPLLQNAGIPEASGYGGFPVDGQWLICKNPDLVPLHHAKVYGKAALGAPPMSVPHLDTRFVDGKRMLLFGPFAGFTTKYLKQGSHLDLFKSLAMDNLKPMIAVGFRHIDLTIYLIREILQSQKARCRSLRDYFPQARDEDWELAYAGKRVQIIKKHPEKGGTLEFGTEVVASADGTLSALLGASPGASTTVPIMLTLLKRCMPEKMESEEWKKKLKAMIPAYGEDLLKDDALFRKIRKHNLAVLKLDQELEN